MVESSRSYILKVEDLNLWWVTYQLPSKISLKIFVEGKQHILDPVDGTLGLYIWNKNIFIMQADDNLRIFIELFQGENSSQPFEKVWYDLPMNTSSQSQEEKVKFGRPDNHDKGELTLSYKSCKRVGNLPINVLIH